MGPSNDYSPYPAVPYPTGTAPQSAPSNVPSGQNAQRRPGKPRKSGWRRVLRGFFFVLLFFFLSGAGAGIFYYLRITASLPGVDDLQSHASQFETTRILDRDGNLLYEIIDPNAGRREYIRIDDISPFMIAAIIATEDKDFYSHPGFDLVAIVRAAIQNLSAGETVSGASTITQQLARNLLLDSGERNQRTIERKVKEIILSAEITRRYSKDQILELYLNESYFGNFAYGIEAASQTYFGVPAKFMNLAQASFLAGLPQAPSIYDVYTNYEATMARQKTVITLMYLVSREKNCIAVGNSSSRVCVRETDVSDAIREIESTNFREATFSITYPHWVTLVRSQLEETYGAQALYRMGLTVYTTIDPELQESAQEIVTRQVAGLAANNAHGGALVAIEVETGQIVAMVGSPDFHSEENSGQVNMATAPRQPGSTLKPLIYAAAFEKGWTPATQLWDVPTDFSPTGKAEDLLYSAPYSPVNYDGSFHGLVLARDALANSYNIPAVKALERVGIYEDPEDPSREGFVSFAQRFGLSSLDRPDFGLSIALGGAETSLVEMTTAYNVLANQGVYVRPQTILRIVDQNGVTVFEADQPELVSVLAEEYAYQLTSILSDRAARAPMFGTSSMLDLPFEAAVKTGTTNDFRDNLTIGYTPKMTVGVWVGNPDYTPMVSTTGVSGAAPIWHEFMIGAEAAWPGGISGVFRRPAGIVDYQVCALSGTVPSESCGARKLELFAAYQAPLPASEDLLQKTWINPWNGLRANEYCPENTQEIETLNVRDEAARRWLLTSAEGNAWAKRYGLIQDGKPVYFTPTESCAPGQSGASLALTNLNDGMILGQDSVEIQGVFSAPDGIRMASIEFGRGAEPGEWYVVQSWNDLMIQSVQPLATWHIAGLENGEYTVRLIAMNSNGGTAETRVRVRIDRPPAEVFEEIRFFETPITVYTSETPYPDPYAIPTRDPDLYDFLPTAEPLLVFP